MPAGTRPLLSAVAAAAAIAALGGGVAQAAPAPHPAPGPAHATGNGPVVPPAALAPPKPAKPAPNPSAVHQVPKNVVIAPQFPAAPKPPAPKPQGAPQAGPATGAPVPGAPAPTVRVPGGVASTGPVAPAPAPAPEPAQVIPGGALPIPPNAPGRIPAPATAPAPQDKAAPVPAAPAPSRPIVLVPSTGDAGRVPTPSAPTAPAQTAPDKSVTPPVQGSVTVPDPIPGPAPSRPLVMTPSAPGGATSVAPGVGAGAIDKSAVVYTPHPTVQVTDGDIHAGLLAAGVNPQMLSTFTSATRTIIGGESGGSTNAVNRWDSNAWGAAQADGAPHNSSRGVMQTIPGTFAAYHAPGTSASIYDPVANIAAAWRYINARYGVDLQTGAGLDSFMARGTGRGVGY